MLLAAPLTILLVLAASILLGIDLGRAPQQAAYLVGLTLLGTWGILIANKLGEGRNVRPATRRVVSLLIGLILGAIGVALGAWTKFRLAPSWEIDPWLLTPELVLWTGPAEQPSLLAHAVYFGLAFATVGWWKLTARDRPSRFRIGPVVLACLDGLLLGGVWPFPQPWGLTVLGLVAMVSQVVSPWSKAAAYFARRSKFKVA